VFFSIEKRNCNDRNIELCLRVRPSFFCRQSGTSSRMDLDDRRWWHPNLDSRRLPLPSDRTVCSRLDAVRIWLLLVSCPRHSWVLDRACDPGSTNRRLAFPQLKKVNI